MTVFLIGTAGAIGRASMSVLADITLDISRGYLIAISFKIPVSFTEPCPLCSCIKTFPSQLVGSSLIAALQTRLPLVGSVQLPKLCVSLLLGVPGAQHSF